jgi:septal ring factor EnvC (AmiA/AmiB activator)
VTKEAAKKIAQLEAELLRLARQEKHIRDMIEELVKDPEGYEAHRIAEEAARVAHDLQVCVNCKDIDDGKL